VRSGKYRSAATNPGQLIVKATGDGFVISVAHEATKFHQTGTKFMIARPLRLSFGDRTAMVREIGDYIFSAYG
jgi:hypothetical protein